MECDLRRTISLNGHIASRRLVIANQALELVAQVRSLLNEDFEGQNSPELTSPNFFCIMINTSRYDKDIIVVYLVIIAIHDTVPRSDECVS